MHPHRRTRTTVLEKEKDKEREKDKEEEKDKEKGGGGGRRGGGEAKEDDLDRVYGTSGHRADVDEIVKGISVCTSCVDAPERPPCVLAVTEPGGPKLQEVPLAALNGRHAPGERRRPPPSLPSLPAEDVVDMSTDDLKERYKRTVRMARMMAYTLTEDTEEELPPAGAWTMIKKRELASLRVCCFVYVRFLCLRCASLATSGCFACLPRHPRSKVVVPDVPLVAKSLFRVISLHMAVDFGDARSTTQLRPPTPLDAPPLGEPHPPRPFPHHHHHHHHHHPYQLHHHPQEPISEPEPNPYMKMKERWDCEWKSKEESYIEPGEHASWWAQNERTLEEAMAKSEPIRFEPGRAPVLSVFRRSPNCDLERPGRSVSRGFRVICAPFLCFPSCL